MTTTPPEPEQPFGAGQVPYPGPQQPPAQAPYGNYPTGPAGSPVQRPPAPEQPSSVATAVKLMWAGAGLGVVSMIYTLVTLGGLKDRVTDQLRDSDPGATAAEIDAFYAISIISGLVGGAIAIGLWAWMAWKNGQGRGWARIVATVLAGFNLLGVPFSIFAARAEPVSLVFTAINVVIAVVVLVLLWRRQSTAFYEGTAASRRMY